MKNRMISYRQCRQKSSTAAGDWRLLVFIIGARRNATFVGVETTERFSVAGTRIAHVSLDFSLFSKKEFNSRTDFMFFL